MTPETCPGCGAKLEPEMLACPSCPMSFPEDEPSSGAHPLRQTKAYAFLMPALLFAAIGAGVWYMAIGLFRLGEQNAVLETSPVLFGKPAPAPASTASSTPESSSPEASSVPVEAEPESEPESATVSIVAQEPEKKRKPAREWRLRGRIYDLTTLQPVPGCKMVFVDEPEGRRIETRSSADGRYKVVVPSLPDRGYLVSIAKLGYSPAYLNPGTEGVTEMPHSRRLEFSKELSSTLSATPYSVQAYDARPLLTDFYLAPRP